MNDYALVFEGEVLTAHRADCPHARVAAASGAPVLTMLDTKVPLTEDGPGFPLTVALSRHDCLLEP